jgi:hypothetical protein
MFLMASSNSGRIAAMEILLTELEQAINFWRNRHPSTGEEQKLCSEANALATPYAEMIVGHLRHIDEATLPEAARAALAQWRQLQPATETPGVKA